MTAELPGPAPVNVHDPALTAVVAARRIDELVRALNYTTRPGDPRIGDVADVYAALGAPREAFGKLPQACAQIAAFLDRRRADGALTAVSGFAHAGAPELAVATAGADLDRAAGAAAQAGAAFGRAQVAVSGLADDGSAGPAEQQRPPRPGAGAVPALDQDNPGVSR